MLKTMEQTFCPPHTSPYRTVEWETRTAELKDDQGKTVFRQEGVRFPRFWSSLAVNIVASKYFRGTLGTPEREYSLEQMVSRVVQTIAHWGLEGGYFSEEAGQAFANDLMWLLIHQYLSFNSPVWFNVGAPGVTKPQTSACFIVAVEDNMPSILKLAVTEGTIFKGGSGSGVNLSKIRGSMEGLSWGGIASGPLSFMKGYDALAGAIKSGGRTRRAAKMIVLDVDHPDIEEFITCKGKEERKGYDLMEKGYSGGLDGEAFSSVFFQNANHSVRVTDAFMEAVLNDREWHLTARRDGHVIRTVRARDLFRLIQETAHRCGDPGLQFADTINRWHTSKATGPIEASNPCGEYLHLNNTSCNLASLNLVQFMRADGRFDTEAFMQAVRITILAQEILVSNSSYPTPEIEANTHRFRNLGLGFANLGAFLMRKGWPYDSAKGRAWAAAIAALLTGTAYLQSAEMAAAMGPFAGYKENEASMREVIERHLAYAKALTDDVREAAHPIHSEYPGLITDSAADPADREFAVLANRVVETWTAAYEKGQPYGYRNAQVSVCAPTGTIALAMDCDTTGLEPDFALVKRKNLVGRGVTRIVNQSVAPALSNLGYTGAEIRDILAHIDKTDTMEGAPHLKAEHLPVFDCAVNTQKGVRSIRWQGHVDMLGALSPFFTGGLSKTVNLPEAATPDDMGQAFIRSWKLGVKCVALYRNGSKGVQPLVTSTKEEKSVTQTPERSMVPAPARRHLPATRKSITHKFVIGGEYEGYFTVGLFPDGTPGEIFITMAKEGSTLAGMCDSYATALSLGLQFGVPLHLLVDKFKGVRFEPSGWTGNQIRSATSVVDYIAQWLELVYLQGVDPESIDQKGVVGASAASGLIDVASNGHRGGAVCPRCGGLMLQSGNCQTCTVCGSASGGCG